jgi:preprotein translocase SecE subunit
VAQKKQASASSKKETTKVTRITASDDATPKKKTNTAAPKKRVAVSKDTQKVTTSTKLAKSTSGATKKSDEKDQRPPLVSLGEYFAGAWNELRQVRWPNRRTTWALTFAVLIFTAFFVVVIILLDYGFQWLFQRILG